MRGRRQEGFDLGRAGGVVGDDEQPLPLAAALGEVGAVEHLAVRAGGRDVLGLYPQPAQQRVQGLFRLGRLGVVAAQVHQEHPGEPAAFEDLVADGVGEGGLADPAHARHHRHGTFGAGIRGEELQQRRQVLVPAGELGRQGLQGVQR